MPAPLLVNRRQIVAGAAALPLVRALPAWAQDAPPKADYTLTIAPVSLELAPGQTSKRSAITAPSRGRSFACARGRTSRSTSPTTAITTGLAKFDTSTKSFQTYPIPTALNSDTAQQSMVMPKGVAIAGKVWTNMVNRQSVMRMDLATGAFELIDPFASVPPGSGVEHSPYGMIIKLELTE